MKKTVLVLLMFLMFSPVYGETIHGSVPSFDVYVQGVQLDKFSSTYPIVTYREMTYIPLTSDYAKGLGLALEFTREDGLNIRKTTPDKFKQEFLQGHFKVGQKIEMTRVPFDVTLNGELLVSEYPLLFYRNIVYLPLTWHIVYDMLAFSYTFDRHLFIGDSDKLLLDVQRVHMTVGESIHQLGICFTLSEPYDLVIKMDGHTYPLERSLIEVLREGEQLYAYKGTIDVLPDSSYGFRIENDRYESHLLTTKSLNGDSTRMAYFGDLQGYKQSQYDRFNDVYKQAQTHNPDLNYIAGDLVDIGDDWSEWGYLSRVLDEHSSDILVTAFGNHDNYGSSSIYESSFQYPNNGLVETRNFYFDLPHARVAVIDTESYGTYSEQGEWLKAIMEVDKHKIVLMHRSVYPVFYNETGVRKFSEYFDEAGINLVLSGHDHIYSRTIMKDGVRDDQGTVYIVGGSGSGSKFYNQEVKRPWQQVVYDDNHPVFSILDITEDEIHIRVYAYEKSIQLIDEIKRGK